MPFEYLIAFMIMSTFVYLYFEFLFLHRMPTMNHTVFSGIIQMRTYDLVFNWWFPRNSS